ncbi:MAG: bacillithiol biosynthesis cysteine-adding enzyme BshC [Gemmatimonadetes bacterium]|nr:bacillithiol biosynthesis cysteine-adding enzyme BshC [Gemmatimonadota bacterium]
MNLDILVQPIDGSRLVQDYLKLDAVITNFFAASPWDLNAYRRKLAATNARFDRPTRERIAASLRVSSPRARERLHEFVERNGAFVTTGQQPGLFSGPLYTIHKALSVVRLAQALEACLDRPILPLFWVASEDHDWVEVNQATIPDVNNDLRVISVESTETRPLPIHDRVLGPELEAAVEQLIQLLPSTDFSQRHFSLLRKAYRAGRTLADGFHDVFADLFAPFDFSVVDAADSLVKEDGAAVIRREALSDHSLLVQQQTARLVEAGYHVQVSLQEEGLNLFVNGLEGRQRLFREGDGYRLRGSERILTRADLERLLRTDVARFSPNALLRPVVESAVLPVLAYVAGPGELAYFAQTKTLFEAHGMEMPLVFPRFSATLIERKNQKVLDKLDLELPDLARPPHELASEIARREMPAEVDDVLAALRRDIEAGARQLTEATGRIDPTLEGPVTRARNESLAAFADAQRRILQAVKRRDDVAISQATKARAHLFPEGTPQERVLNVFYYLVRYGDELLQAIAQRFQVEFRP